MRQILTRFIRDGYWHDHLHDAGARSDDCAACGCTPSSLALDIPMRWPVVYGQKLDLPPYVRFYGDREISRLCRGVLTTPDAAPPHWRYARDYSRLLLRSEIVLEYECVSIERTPIDLTPVAGDADTLHAMLTTCGRAVSRVELRTPHGTYRGTRGLPRCPSSYGVVWHGLDRPDTFPGAGVAHTDWTHVYVGAGSNAEEALEDAVESAAQEDEEWYVDHILDETPPDHDAVPDDAEDMYYYVILYIQAPAQGGLSGTQAEEPT